MNEKLFLKRVKDEAQKLRKQLTDIEKVNLSIGVLYPSSRYSCVYGLATGECRSDRAVELIQVCCHEEKMVNQLKKGLYTVNKLKKNGVVKKLTHTKYLSYIEVFIIHEKFRGNNNSLANYISGKTNKLPNIFYK